MTESTEYTIAGTYFNKPDTGGGVDEEIGQDLEGYRMENGLTRIRVGFFGI